MVKSGDFFYKILVKCKEVKFMATDENSRSKVTELA